MKKIDMNKKSAKYFVAHRIKGMSKTKALQVAGVRSLKNTTNIERTQTYQALEARYKDRLVDKLSIDKVADEHVKNILQDQDKGAKNKAIQMYLDKVEPEERKDDDDDRMIVVLSA